MPTFRYRYSTGEPPAASVLLRCAHPVTGQVAADVGALVDAGADQTVVPESLVSALGLPQLDQEVVRGFDGSSQLLPTYLLRVSVRDLTPVEIEVIGSGRTPHAILGRDVLNRYRVVLDGPAGLLEITGD